MIDLPRHQCLIYDQEPVLQIPALARTLRDNLRTNHRCTFYGSHSMVSAMSNWLKADGLELSQLISTGAVTITAERDYQVDGVFNGTKMISLLEESVEQALADGYAGVWASGDVHWELGGSEYFDLLYEYERDLDIFMSQNPYFSCVCQYNRNCIPPNIINSAFKVHPTVYVSNTLSHVNTFYQVSDPALQNSVL